jgi:hypothetical protein
MFMILKGKMTIKLRGLKKNVMGFLTKNLLHKRSKHEDLSSKFWGCTRKHQKHPNTNEDLRAFAWNVSPTELSYRHHGSVIFGAVILVVRLLYEIMEGQPPYYSAWAVKECWRWSGYWESLNYWNWLSTSINYIGWIWPRRQTWCEVATGTLSSETLSKRPCPRRFIIAAAVAKNWSWLWCRETRRRLAGPPGD